MTAVEANVVVMAAMAKTYNEEPHYSPENRARVRSILEGLGGGRLLDLGCGTGFILDLAHDLFTEIHGIDVSPEMLARVTPRQNVTLHEGLAEALPFADAQLDAVTAYSFLHHLEDYLPVLREVRRVLKPGGRFYADLEPNAEFWALMGDLDGRRVAPAVDREIHAALRRDAEVAREFGIDAGVFDKAENLKSRGGIYPAEFALAAGEAGFAACTVTRHWFMAQGRATSAYGPDAEAIDGWLRAIAPASDRLYKYLRLELVA